MGGGGGDVPLPSGGGSTRFYPKSSFWHTSFQAGMVMDLALRVPADMMGWGAVQREMSLGGRDRESRAPEI